MKRLYFVRHGETEWNREARMQGTGNSDLTELGRTHASNHAELLSGLGVEAMFASPLGRARETAEIVNQRLQLEVRYDDRIVEWDCGEWGGFLYAEVQSRWADEWAAFEVDRYAYRAPGAENWPDMIERSTPFVRELLADPAESIAIVSHGLIGRVMISTLMQFDRGIALDLRQPNDVVYRVTVDRDERSLERSAAGEGPFTAFGDA